jgi:hypothetical protein
MVKAPFAGPVLCATKLKAAGSEVIVQNTALGDKTRHDDLFLVMSSRSDKPEILMQLSTKQRMSEAERIRRKGKFVDQLDLHGDGTDETITISTHYES